MRVPGAALLHPVAIAAMGTMVVNDHVLKQAMPSMLTGKLSDVAGLVFFPLVLLSLWEWTRGRAAGRWAVGGAVLLTGVVFAAIQLWTPAGELWAWGLGALQAPFRGGWRPVPHTADPADLLALPSLAVAAWIARRRSW